MIARVGGGLFVGGTGQASVTNSSISACKAEADGGAISSNDASHVSVINSTLVTNQATQHGGAVSLNSRGESSFLGCGFEGNSALRGGAIREKDRDGLQHIYEGLTLSNNSAITGGGAFYMDTSFNITCTGCEYLDNQAAYGPDYATPAIGFSPTYDSSAIISFAGLVGVSDTILSPVSVVRRDHFNQEVIDTLYGTVSARCNSTTLGGNTILSFDRTSPVVSFSDLLLLGRDGTIHTLSFSMDEITTEPENIDTLLRCPDGTIQINDFARETTGKPPRVK